MAKRLLVSLDVFGRIPLYSQVADGIARYITDGKLESGERLPSVRRLSRQLNVSIDTIKQALNLLKNQGLIRAVAGSGYYVSKPPHAVPANSNRQNAGSPSPLDLKWARQAKTILQSQPAIDKLYEQRLEFDFRANDRSFCVPYDSRWERCYRKWIGEYILTPYEYQNAAGLAQLRQEVANWLQRSGITQCSASQVLITSGLSQARHIVAQLMVCSDKLVVMEDPCIPRERLAYLTHGARVVHVPFATDAHALHEVKDASLIHLSSANARLTGQPLSEERCREVLDWADENRVVIVEDGGALQQTFSSDKQTSLFDLAMEQGATPVIYIGSLSCYLPFQCDLGFMLVPDSLQQLFLRARWLFDRHTSSVTQGLALLLFQSGLFDHNILRIDRLAARRSSALHSTLESWPNELFEKWCPNATFRHPILFRQDIDDQLFCRVAAEHGIGLTAMSSLYQQSVPRHGLLVDISGSNEDCIAAGMSKLFEVTFSIYSQAQ